MNAGQFRAFWIEAGAMSGGSRNQLELPNDLAEFFDESSRQDEIVRVRLPDGQIHDCSLTYRGTDYGQWTNIWRLGLPTEAKGGPPYSSRAIKFERRTVDDTVVYEVAVADIGSSEFAVWNSHTTSRGITASGGGRSYGFW